MSEPAVEGDKAAALVTVSDHSHTSSDKGAQAQLPTMDEKRQSRPTQKALEANYLKQCNSRKAKLGQITSKRNVIKALMDDYKNVELVKQEFNEFNSKANDFKLLHSAVRQLLSEEEATDDHEQWFMPKYRGICEFHDLVLEWINNAPPVMAQRPPDVSPKGTKATSVKSVDNVSVGKISRTNMKPTTSSSAFKQAEADRAALLARAAALKKMQALELQETQLKAKREALELEMEIKAADARMKALVVTKHVDTKSVNPLIHINEYFESMQLDSQRVDNDELHDEEDDDDEEDDGEEDEEEDDDDDDGVDQTRQQQRQRRPNTGHDFQDDGANAPPVGMIDILRKQNEITQMLIQEQRFSRLPSREVPVFTGDPLSYISFIQAFEHCIESKTSNNRDRLLFLEQFTDGQPKTIVRSCLHMDSQKGYVKAKRLLRKHFGNEVLIAAAYQEKILNWDVIRSEDSKALHTYALFLRTCCNAMSNNEILQDMNNPTHLKTVLSKLPFKYRERWRTVAYDYHERNHRRAKFPQLVNFIERQANIAIDPLFGERQEDNPCSP